VAGKKPITLMVMGWIIAERIFAWLPMLKTCRTGNRIVMAALPIEASVGTAANRNGGQRLTWLAGRSIWGGFILMKTLGRLLGRPAADSCPSQWIDVSLASDLRSLLHGMG